MTLPKRPITPVAVRSFPQIIIYVVQCEREARVKIRAAPPNVIVSPASIPKVNLALSTLNTSEEICTG